MRRSPHHGLTDRLAQLAVLASGMTLALQARINGQLRVRMHSVWGAAAVSFGGGLLLLVVVVVTTRRRPLARLMRAPGRWFWWLGGLGGAVSVSAVAAGTPRVGVSVVSIATAAGTVSGGLFADRIGLGPGGVHAVSARRFTGAGIAVSAVVLTSSPALVGSGDLPVLVWVLAGGFGTACQQAVNGQLMRRSGDAVVAALVSFAVGSLALLAVVAVIRPQLTWPTTWWLYTGGSYAAVYIVISAAVVGRLGVFRLTLAAVGGQLTGALILDLVSPVAGRHVTWQTVLGTALAVGAVAIAAPRSRGVATTAR